jgi:hypothetical protein
MQEAAKNYAFLGKFFHYFLWGGREGGRWQLYIRTGSLKSTKILDFSSKIQR